jgi:hypothetical protein
MVEDQGQLDIVGARVVEFLEVEQGKVDTGSLDFGLR